MKKLLKNIVSRTSIVIFMMFLSVYNYAQTTPVKEQDSVKTGYSLGQISLPNPKSIIDGY